MSRKLFKKAILAIVSVTFFAFNSFAQDGEKLFNNNCKSCHSPGSKKVVGPGLKDAETHWKDKALLHNWIRNSAAVLKSGDAYANDLFKKYNSTAMTAFPSLTDKDIDAILGYIAAYKAPVDIAGDSTATSGGAKKEDNTFMMYLLIGLGIVFVVLINVLAGIKKSLNKLAAEKDGEHVTADFKGTTKERVFHWMGNNKKWVAVIALVLVAWGSKVGWESLWNIGVYEGYRPEQPIKFSHKLHAGKNAINCVYCHSGVERGKTSGVPSANVCMNCHKFVKEGPVYGKTEIAKIYAALDYNPETDKYGPNKKPIQWIRVHNLPDHVYFNHSQHVVVGKQECATCHGDVKTMDVIEQKSGFDFFAQYFL